jgi:catechol 2,3-dioxygenase-like lactoylglutathione lyase family enzyme
MEILAIHHVSLTVSDLGRSKRFYREILSFNEITRPNFDSPGAWFQLAGSQQVHLNVYSGATFREKPLNTHDVHFAVRVRSYQAAVEFLHAKGFREDADINDPYCMILRPRSRAGFPQIYICDPDRHIIEINSERLNIDS